MEILIDPHTLEQSEERGTNKNEIEDVIRTGFSIPAKYGRIGRLKSMILNRHVLTSIMNKRKWKCSIL